jgi:uncharacterized OB-fold protein
MTILQMPGPGIPLPAPSVISQPFWDGCARGELLFQRCLDCDRAIFNPASICRYCTSSRLEWRASAGRGEVYSWTVAWRPQHPAFPVPYAVAIVELDEGYQMLANIAGCAPDDLRVGARVAVFFQQVGANITLPIFKPA